MNSSGGYSKKEENKNPITTRNFLNCFVERQTCLVSKISPRLDDLLLLNFLCGSVKDKLYRDWPKTIQELKTALTSMIGGSKLIQDLLRILSREFAS